MNCEPNIQKEDFALIDLSEVQRGVSFGDIGVPRYWNIRTMEFICGEGFVAFFRPLAKVTRRNSSSGAHRQLSDEENHFSKIKILETRIVLFSATKCARSGEERPVCISKVESIKRLANGGSDHSRESLKATSTSVIHS